MLSLLILSLSLHVGPSPLRTLPRITPRAHAVNAIAARNLDCIATIDLYEPARAQQAARVHFADGDFPCAPAYMFKLNGVVRACLFVNETHTSQAVRMMYDSLLLINDAMPTFRSLVYARDRNMTLDNMPASERFNFLFL